MAQRPSVSHVLKECALILFGDILKHMRKISTYYKYKRCNTHIMYKDISVLTESLISQTQIHTREAHCTGLKLLSLTFTSNVKECQQNWNHWCKVSSVSNIYTHSFFIVVIWWWNQYINTNKNYASHWTTLLCRTHFKRPSVLISIRAWSFGAKAMNLKI